jgi:hypothetical protein
LATVVNDRTIDNTGSGGGGVCLDAGGSVINTGSIQDPVGVWIASGALAE